MEKFEFKKSLGQNFLKDENIIFKIANSIEVDKNDIIIEIGPGAGALTKRLVNKECNILCFEIDKRLKKYLNVLEEKNKNLHIYFEDFLQVDFKKILSNFKYKNIFIVANLPYYITTPIISKIIESNINVKTMTLMVQKEVGERFMAKPNSKSYNSLSIFLQYFFEIERLCLVKKECFVPVPKVDSIVLTFKSRVKKLKPKDEKFFFELVKNSFKFKRKTLKNNLKNYNIVKLEEILKDLNYNDNVRAEQISIHDFIKISDYLS